MPIWIYSTIGAALIAFGAGWKIHSWKTDADIKDTLEKQQAAYAEKVVAFNIAISDANVKRLELAADLATARADKKVIYRTITKEVPSYVPPNTDTCNYDLDAGLVRILNSAARGSAPAQSADTSPGQLLGALPGESSDLAGGQNRWPN